MSRAECAGKTAWCQFCDHEGYLCEVIVGDFLCTRAESHDGGHVACSLTKCDLTGDGAKQLAVAAAAGAVSRVPGVDRVRLADFIATKLDGDCGPGVPQYLADSIVDEFTGFAGPVQVAEAELTELLLAHHHAYSYETGKGRRYVGCACHAKPTKRSHAPDDEWLAAHHSTLIAEWLRGGGQ